MRNIVNALLVRDGLVLLARRSLNRRAYPGLWSFPGGHVEQSETLTQALVRELREEIGVIPTKFYFVGTIREPNALETEPAIYHMYAVTEWEGEPALVNYEHVELRWFTPTGAISLPDLALSQYRTFLAGTPL